MPTNVDYEYIEAEKKFHEAKTPKEKFEALKKMLSTAPTHKGAEKLRNDIKKKISQLKQNINKAKQQKKTKSLTIKKEGAGTLAIIGFPNSGKSTLLSKLSGKSVPIGEYEFTTKNPEQRMIPFENIKLQGIEIPAIYQGFSESKNSGQLLSLIKNTDMILIIIKDKEDLNIIKQELKKGGIELTSKEKHYENFIFYMPYIIIQKDMFEDPELLNKVWKKLGKIRISTKTKGKGIAKKPIILDINSTVRYAAKIIHKDFVKKFRYAKIWGPSAKFKGQQVGLDHKLKDNDIIEIFTN